MKKLIKKILTDKKARDAKALRSYMTKVADVGTPWQPD